MPYEYIYASSPHHNILAQNLRIIFLSNVRLMYENCPSSIVMEKECLPVSDLNTLK